MRREPIVVEHRYSFEVEGTPQEIWPMFWHRQNVEHGATKIEILHKGDELGNGLVRRCWFRVPKYLLSSGVGRSWEWLTEVRPCESWRYDAVGKPLYSEATGRTRLEDLGNGRTRVHFHETYHVFNPVLRFFLEKPVHRFISKDNDRLIKRAIEQHVARTRAKRAKRAPETAAR
jgi:hypothetical protein